MDRDNKYFILFYSILSDFCFTIKTDFSLEIISVPSLFYSFLKHGFILFDLLRNSERTNRSTGVNKQSIGLLY